MKTEVFRMERVTYCENETRKLNNLDLQVFGGEILGILPLNSYGLPELLEVIRKNPPLEFGFVFLKEKCVSNWHQPQLGHNPIGMIQSDSQLVEGLSLAENIFVLRKGFRAWYIRSGLLRTQLAPFFERIGVDIPLDAYPEELTSFQRVVVELLRAMVAGYRLIIIYDISTILSKEELEQFQRILKQGTKEGVSFLYVGFHPEEIADIADRVALFSNGRILKTIYPKDVLQHVQNAGQAAPRKVQGSYAPKSEPAVFRGEKLTLEGMRELSFSIAAGECLVIQDTGDLITHPLLKVLLGESRLESGLLWLGNCPAKFPFGPHVAVIQQSPAQSMLFPQMSYFDNLFLTSDHHLPNIWRNRRMKHRLAKEYAYRNGVDLFERSIDSLSEKEKYELVYNRVLLQKPTVVFCVRPFKGADMELREHIRKLIQQLQAKKIAVVIMTSNALETIQLADRIVEVGT